MGRRKTVQKTKKVADKKVAKDRKDKSNNKIRGQRAFLTMVLKVKGANVAIIPPKKKSSSGVTVVEPLSIHLPGDVPLNIIRKEVEDQLRESVYQHVEKVYAAKANPDNSKMGTEKTRTLRKNINDYINNVIVKHIENHLFRGNCKAVSSKKCDVQTGKENNLVLKKITIHLECFNKTITMTETQMAECGNEWLAMKAEDIGQFKGKYEITDSQMEIESLMLKHSQTIYAESSAEVVSCYLSSIEQHVTSMLDEECEEMKQEVKEMKEDMEVKEVMEEITENQQEMIPMKEEQKVTLPSLDPFLREIYYDNVRNPQSHASASAPMTVQPPTPTTTLTAPAPASATSAMTYMNESPNEEQISVEYMDSFYPQGDMFEESMNTSFSFFKSNPVQQQPQEPLQLQPGFYVDNMTGCVWYVENGQSMLATPEMLQYFQEFINGMNQQ